VLSDYSKEQPIAYNVLKNEINNKTITHAYLFHSSNQYVTSTFALSFAKTLLCPISTSPSEKCNDCSICKRIDNGNFPELKIIEPDGLWIKKEQLLDLQDNFKMKSLEGDKRIYIIKEVEKLNAQAANSILKFLEEPDPNIIAILTTSNIHTVLQTIISRCQVISLKENISWDEDDIAITNNANITVFKIAKLYYKSKQDIDIFLSDEKNVKKIEAAITFIRKYENIKLDILTEMKKLWFDYFGDKNEYIFGLDIMALFYKDVLNFVYERKLELFDSYIDDLKMVASLNKTDDIIYKIQKILLIKEKVKYNINTNLLMDKLILELESGEYV
jgi:DNA polymerase-3 subunit delta'